MPIVSKEAFDIIAEQTGLPLSETQKATLFAVYPTLQAIVARAAAPLPREAEPSLTFTAEIR
jgi:hypothetical protein